jgi:hypothetical protein
VFTDPGLGEMNQLGGAREAVGFRHRVKDPQFIQIYHNC